MFETLKPLPPDAILGIMTLFRADPHRGKSTCSVGVYQDEQGRTPVLASVKRAEKAIIDAQDSKTYVAIAGNAGFNRGVEELRLRRESSRAQGRPRRDGADAGRQRRLEHRGALAGAREAEREDLLERPVVAEPFPLLKLSGLTLESYPYYDFKKHRVDFDAMKAKLDTAKAGEIVLIHGCCHNPCGADLTKDQWQDLARSASGAGSCRSSISLIRGSPRASSRTRTERD